MPSRPSIGFRPATLPEYLEGSVAGRNADSVLPKLFLREGRICFASALFQNGVDLVSAEGVREECAADFSTP